MPAQNVGIVYSKNQQVIRRVIHTRWIGYDENHNPIIDPNAHDDLLKPHKEKLFPGEGWTVIPCDIYDSHKHVMDHHTFLKLKGIPGVTDRCIVHDGGNVKAVVLADPLIDTHPAGMLATDVTGQAEVGHAVIKGVAQIPTGME